MARKQIVAGNWKMNTDFETAISLAESVAKGQRSEEVITILGVPFPYLNKVQAVIANYKHIGVSAQNCHHKESGAYTGEVSAEMLRSIQVPYVIIGHSERREYNNEDSEVLLEKTKLALKHGLKVIFCCGESLEVRRSGEEEAYVLNQLEETIFQLPPQDFRQIVIAYEPIWAIGTGETATSQQAQDMHASIRQGAEKAFGREISENVSILYGGSVKASNAHELFGMPDVDGGLVGGASLKADEFLSIINSF